MSLKKINARLADQNIELVKGTGYFYFAALPGSPIDTPIPASVYVNRLSDLTIGGWLDAAKRPGDAVGADWS
jgi:hypothetical protein